MVVIFLFELPNVLRELIKFLLVTLFYNQKNTPTDILFEIQAKNLIKSGTPK